MYGYNAVISVSGQDSYNYALGSIQFNKFFYGPSFGIGLDFYSRRNNTCCWTVDVIVPVRNADVNNYINYLENTEHASFKTKPLPVLASIAYRFSKKK